MLYKPTQVPDNDVARITIINIYKVAKYYYTVLATGSL